MTLSQIQEWELKMQSRHPVRLHTRALPKEVAPKHEKIVRTCIHCKVQFSIKPFRLKHGGGQYCTRECHNAFRRGIREAELKILGDNRRQRKRAYMAAYREKKAREA